MFTVNDIQKLRIGEGVALAKDLENIEGDVEVDKE